MQKKLKFKKINMDSKDYINSLRKKHKIAPLRYSFISAKGGSGQSTLAVLMYRYYKEIGRMVFFDAESDIKKMLGINEVSENALSDLSDFEMRISDIDKKTVVTDLSSLSSDTRIIRELKESDVVIIPMMLNEFSLKKELELCIALKSCGVKPIALFNCVGLEDNNGLLISESTKLFLEKCKEVLKTNGIRFFKTAIPYSDNYKKAILFESIKKMLSKNEYTILASFSRALMSVWWPSSREDQSEEEV